MKRRIVLFVYCLAVLLGQAACGNSASIDVDGGNQGMDASGVKERPFIKLTDFAKAKDALTYSEFKRWVDRAVAGNEGWGYTCVDAVHQSHISQEQDFQYLKHAIAMVDGEVKLANFDIAGGNEPDVSENSYLHVDDYIGELAFAYDYGHKLLTEDQRKSWEAFAEQTLTNVWDHENAHWGNMSAQWTGWATDNPGNNYYFHFWRATLLWALASQNQKWLDFLEDVIHPMVKAYYQQAPGGGSREGTGYGVAQGVFFENMMISKASLGRDLASEFPHEKDSIEYLIHSTVPTLDKYAPSGDNSRESYPWLFDYHVLLAIAASLGSRETLEARHGAWWLEHVPVHPTGPNLRLTLLMPTGIPAEAPTALSYCSPFTGDCFVRSAWTSDAFWAAFIAGPYQESHAHSNQGNFSLYKGDWLSVTSNIWSHSGLQGNQYNPYLGTEAYNVLRFVRPNGSVVLQNHSNSSITQSTDPNGVMTVNADLTPAYSGSQGAVESWTRQFTFDPQARTLRVIDVCEVVGVSAIFQVHVPVQPSAPAADGSITAGNLRIQPGSGMTIQVVSMPAINDDITKGWRVDIRNPSGCNYNVLLTALAP